MKRTLSCETYLEFVERESPEAARVLDHLFDMVDGHTGIWLNEHNTETVSIRFSLLGRTKAFTVGMFHLPQSNYRDSGKGDRDVWFGLEIRTNSRPLTEVEERVTAQWCQALDEAGIGEAVDGPCHRGRTLSYAEVVGHREQIEELLRELIDGLAGG